MATTTTTPSRPPTTTWPATRCQSSAWSRSATSATPSTSCRTTTVPTATRPSPASTARRACVLRKGIRRSRAAVTACPPSPTGTASWPCSLSVPSRKRGRWWACPIGTGPAPSNPCLRSSRTPTTVTRSKRECYSFERGLLELQFNMTLLFKAKAGKWTLIKFIVMSLQKNRKHAAKVEFWKVKMNFITCFKSINTVTNNSTFIWCFFSLFVSFFFFPVFFFFVVLFHFFVRFVFEFLKFGCAWSVSQSFFISFYWPLS